jgi:hypothetical protein
MTGFFSVTNYDQQQHYKDRGPTWIKLYNRLLDDYGFAQLPDAAKWHLIGIFLLASRHANRIPADPAWLARQVSACDPIDLSVLEHSGFIAPVADVDGAWDLFGKAASPEKKKEEKNREDILSAGADPSKLFSSAFETFWNGYPTDPLMSKKKAAEIWRRMIALAPMLHDWRTRGRVHNASWAAFAAIVAVRLVRIPLAETLAWHDVAGWLSGLAG